MPAIEDLLQGILEPTGASSERVGIRAAENKDQELDVAGFVEDLGKTAELLYKAAESLPSSPRLVAEQLKMLKEPAEVSREDIHGQHQDFVAQVLPAAKSSLSVPGSIDAIQKIVKKAEAPEAPEVQSRSWLLGQLGRS